MNYWSEPRFLPNGAPFVRLLALTNHFHSLGPRALFHVLEDLIEGRIPDNRALVQRLEDHTRLCPEQMKAFDTYHLPPPMMDMSIWSWFHRREDEDPGKADAEETSIGTPRP
jgi:hypothetical protein